jgi:hypothetical protein
MKFVFWNEEGITAIEMYTGIEPLKLEEIEQKWCYMKNCADWTLPGRHHMMQG